MTDAHDIVFELTFSLLKFTFLPWIQLSLTCHRYRNEPSRKFYLWKAYTMGRLYGELGKELVDTLFSNDFSIMGSFLLDCIYETNFAHDVDIIQDNKVTIGKDFTHQYLSNDNEMVNCVINKQHRYTCRYNNNEDFSRCDCMDRFRCNIHYECNPKLWDSVKPVRHLLSDEYYSQYPPGYETDPAIFIAETYIPKEFNSVITSMDFITVTCNQTPRQFVSNNDFAFCKVLFDGKSLFVSNLESIVTKSTSFTKIDMINNYNRTTTNKIVLGNKLNSEWCLDLLLQREFWYNKERIKKYRSRGFVIELDDDINFDRHQGRQLNEDEEL